MEKSPLIQYIGLCEPLSLVWENLLIELALRLRKGQNGNPPSMLHRKRS